MNSELDREHLSALMDDSLEGPQRLAFEARVATSPALRLELQEMRHLRAAIQSDARHFTAPDRLRARVRNAARVPAVDASRSIRWGWLRVTDWSGVFGWQPLGAVLGFAALMLWTASMTLGQPGKDERLMQAAVASHMRATTGRRLVDLASSDEQAVQPWLSERLAFSERVRLPATAEADLVGARLDSLEGRAVAAVVYRLRDHVVNTFIWPADDDGSGITSASLQGFNVSHWSRGGLRYCVVSDLPRGQLVAFAESFAQKERSQP
jgi:anti-sigma factor RsiW